MDNCYLLENLNEPQKQAVTADPGHVLVLAGAGSGKTRVLVHRIAWLISEQQVSPYSILSVTFTNKAAAEMRSRIESLLGMSCKGMWVGTFHGLAHRLLRQHWQEAGLPESFQILDSEDQSRLIKRLMKAMEVDDKRWPPRQVQWFINAKKDDGLRAEHVATYGDFSNEVMKKIYLAYEQACQRSGLVDFAELLLRCYELLLNNQELLDHYRQRFQHILVDEFQDTNSIQYAWLRLLAGRDNHMMIVGDDDQSIYGWRGAKIDNIHKFSNDYPGTTIRLEQNYRSTETILMAANQLITQNNERMGKELWTSGEQGDAISVYVAFNEVDEARYIINNIAQQHRDGLDYSQIAILYRSNAQSRILEETLMQQSIPYRVYGGLRFYERAEIKDALAYLRLVNNRHDDAAFERIVNTPTRGIGNQTLNILREHARICDISLWQACCDKIQQQSLSGRAAHSVANFLKLINALDNDTDSLDLWEQTEHVIQTSKLPEHYLKENRERAQSRLENLDELVNATRRFLSTSDEAMTPLSAFLSHAALEAGEGQSESHQECVQLMTLHSAKGLEFPVVFLAGMEEGLFPHKLSLQDINRLEEERRLCYVGITRAMRKLYISYAEVRRMHGQENNQRPSRFITELPQELLHMERMQTKFSKPRSTRPTSTVNYNQDLPSDGGYRIGQRVSHARFGDGVITNYEGNGAQMRVQVKFAAVGTKWLMVSVAKLEPCN